MLSINTLLEFIKYPLLDLYEVYATWEKCILVEWAHFANPVYSYGNSSLYVTLIAYSTISKRPSNCGRESHNAKITKHIRQHTVGAGGLEALAMARIKVGKTLSGDKPGWTFPTGWVSKTQDSNYKAKP